MTRNRDVTRLLREANPASSPAEGPLDAEASAALQRTRALDETSTEVSRGQAHLRFPRSLRRVLVAATVAITLAAVGWATHPIHMHTAQSWALASRSLDDMIKQSDIVVRGRISRVLGTQTDAGGPSTVYTNYEFVVDKQLAGHPTGPILLIHQMGGAHGFFSEDVQGDPALGVGEQAVVILLAYQENSYFILGGPSGRFLVTQGMVRSLPEGLVQLTPPAPVAQFDRRITRIATQVGKPTTPSG